MSKDTRWTVIPVNGYDIPALEGWLTRQAARGWKFTFASGPLARFERMDPRTLQLHLEPIRGKAEEDPMLTDLYGEAGWEYWGIFRGSYHLFATPDPEAQAHTDPETLDHCLGHFLQGKLASSIPILLLNLLLLAIYYPENLDRWDLMYSPVLSSVNHRLPLWYLALLGLILVDLSYLLGLFHLMGHRSQVRKGLSPAAKRRAWDGILLAVGTASLAPVILHLAFAYVGLSNRYYPLNGSPFPTLVELDGLSPYVAMSDDYLHSNNLLEPEYWSYLQEPTTVHDYEMPAIQVQIYRFHLTRTAAQGAEDFQLAFSWVHYYQSPEDFTDLPPTHGFDRILMCEEADGMTLILLRDRTVLRACYRGCQDLTQLLDRWADVMDQL